ncbi:MAG TPA: oligosaccharide flippase family protein [Rhodocyclaceae bacterium]
MTSVFQRTGWIGTERLLRAGSLICVQLLLARYFTLDDYGRFTVLSAYIAIACVVGSLGLDGGLVQSALRSAGGGVYGRLLLSRFGAGALCAAIGAILLSQLQIEQDRVCLLLAAGVAICSMQDFLEAPYLLGPGLRRLLSLRAAIVFLGMVAKVAAAIFIGTLESVLAAWLIESIALVFLHLHLLPADARNGSINQASRFGNGLVSAAVPLWLSGIAICAYLRADQLIIAKLLPSAELAAYGAAQRLFEASFLVQQSLIAALLAPYMTARDRGPAEAAHFLRRITCVIVAFSAVAALLTYLGAELLIDTLFGPRFSAAVPLFQNLCLALPVIAWGVLRSIWIYSNQLGWAALIQNLIAGLLGVNLNLALIPIGGTDYASRIYVLCVLCAFVISGFFIPSMRRLHWQLSYPNQLHR